MSKKLKLRISSRLMKKRVRRHSFATKKHCRFCSRADQEQMIDYKNTGLLRGFLTERSKILPSRVSGNCFYHQRQLARQIKVARVMALLPFCAMHM